MEKAGLIGLVRMRYIESDSEFSMRGDALLEALTCDRAEGLLPFFVSFYGRSIFTKYNFLRIYKVCVYLMHLHSNNLLNTFRTTY